MTLNKAQKKWHQTFSSPTKKTSFARKKSQSTQNERRRFRVTAQTLRNETARNDEVPRIMQQKL